MTDGEDMTSALAERILDARTALLAAPRRDPAAEEDQQILACACGAETYGIPLPRILDILPARRAVRVPGATAPVAGAVGLSGRIWTVVDLGAALGLGMPVPEAAATGHFLRPRGLARRLLLRVERVVGILAAHPLPGREGEGGVPAITGHALAPAGSLTSRPVLVGLLDLDLLLRPLFDPSHPGA